MCLLLLLLLRHSAGILLRQRTADRSGLLGSQVERQVLLLGVEQAQLVALVGVDDGQGTGDGFAEVVSVRKVIDNVSFCFSHLKIVLVRKHGRRQIFFLYEHRG